MQVDLSHRQIYDTQRRLDRVATETTLGRQRSHTMERTTSTRFKRLLFIALAPAFLAEIGSGNTPLAALADPRVDLFLTLAYGFPLLIISELRTRLRLGDAGVFLLGLAYGFINEGLLAQTLIRFDNVPIAEFNEYLYVAGFNLAWTALIVCWHAFISVLFPLALADSWFRDNAGRPVLSDRVFLLLGATLAAAIAFLGIVRTPHPQMLACAVAIGLLTLSAMVFPAHDKDSIAAQPRFKHFLFGFIAFHATLITAIAMAHARVSPALYFGWFALAALVLFGSGRRRGIAPPLRSAALAQGVYASLGAFHALVGFFGLHSIAETLVGIAFATPFVVCAVTADRLPRQAAEG